MTHRIRPRRDGAGDGRPRGQRDGQSMVELAITLPLLLLLMLGTIDIGRAFFDYIQLRSAVREGAGYGSRLPDDHAGIKLRVIEDGVPAVTTITDGTSGVCTVTNGKADGICTVTVTADHTFTPVTTSFLQSWFGLGPINMKVSASMRLLR